MNDPDSPLQIKLFGTFEVRVHGAPLPRLRSRTGQWLLALLALRHSQATDRAWLAGTLWPESDEPLARFYLRRALTDLRRALGAEAGRLLSPTPRSLRLDLTGADCDVSEFDAAVASSDPEALARAAGLYRGPLLEECEENWIVPERMDREAAYRAVLEAQAARARSFGGAAAALEPLRRAAALDPAREDAQRRLMEALAAAGDHAAVTQTYRALRLHLQREYQAAPDARTTALYRRLREQGRRQARAAASTPPDAPPMHRLPEPPTSLIGREQEKEVVIAALDQARLVTLTGAGGVGKTRLALAVAESLADEFREGACFVDLSALSAPDLVPDAVASALGIRPEAGRTLLEPLLGALQGQNLLLILDNCEHLHEACSALAGALRDGVPDLCLLVTSRQALGLPGEVAFRVPSLSLPGESVDKADSDAVRLFRVRAQAAEPSWTLTPGNADAVAQICRHLDGIPLALEMAAARVRTLSIAEIASRMDQRFTLLRGPAAIPRHETLRNTLDWSHDLLGEGERTLLRRLSVFAGGWDLSAAEAVCPGEGLEAGEVLDTLAGLVDKSLVMHRHDAQGRGRYYLLETVRQYAAANLDEAGERSAVQARHGAHFLHFAVEAANRQGGLTQADSLNRLDAEHDNLRAALATCLTDPDGVLSGLCLTASLWRFWQTRGYCREGRQWFEAALTRPGADAPTQERANALNGAGILADSEGDYAAAEPLYRESLALCRAQGDETGMGHAIHNLGSLAASSGRYPEGQALFQECLAIWRKLDFKPGLAVTLGNLGQMARGAHEYALADAYFAEALALSRESGNTSQTAHGLSHLADVAAERGDLAGAQSFFEESLALLREIGDKSGTASALHGLAKLAVRRGDAIAARTFFEESLALSRTVGNKYHAGFVLADLGNLLFDAGETAQARAYYTESLALWRALGNRHEVGLSLARLGHLAAHLRDWQTARVHFGESLACLREVALSAKDTGYPLPDLVRVLAVQAKTPTEARQAARLSGAVAAMHEQEPSQRTEPDGATDLSCAAASLKEILGEPDFADCQAQGRRLSVEEATDEALAAVGDSLMLRDVNIL